MPERVIIPLVNELVVVGREYALLMPRTASTETLGMCVRILPSRIVNVDKSAFLCSFAR